jgi:hypothetical protein
MITFLCYDPSADGGGGIHEWYDGLPSRYRSEVDSTLELLAADPHDFYDQGEVKELRGACEGLTEIKVDFAKQNDGEDDDQIHLRILGCEGRDRKEFVLLIGFEKMNQNAEYGPACRSAQRRKWGVEHDGKRARPCRFP